ncbi:MAG: hypothetical protein UT19_C0004G0103 [Candidatus Woesebacteria bacterium GW2011_GWB1_39_10b]|uniref:Uncharacterized protein n=3 Tax=Candidatus Woeseibacteriota TaxID=1752722 RepID=A0A0G0QJV9_9BACT|nr:MAG: hypothetical protein US72_C0008G0062 [Microgenomates group bacterium GW2011_GWC1_38_12]KKQ94142.1 MAG: hypothetical protein UT19_C0004G0103 [Candidatus Woesebacteria bacterium GW2011_GWB1_39_10b]KKR10695.1 MAG: hypothetical protein UT40_C0046G0014 [Candidatus Woesebacteria bacterium GW2011_GWA1_39_21b]OGM63642.1 MAG: hypothetical protein A3A52_02345 [Candidatus Woesebacteria bacterium RIFCSPLOWO2_01_FULL_39_14]
MLLEMQKSPLLEKTIESWIVQSDLVKEITIEELQDFLKPSIRGNLWVRGSLVRGHFPCGDIDISDYSEGNRFDFHNFPREFKLDPDQEGLPIEYAHVPFEHLEEFLTTYLRYSASADEMIPLTPDNGEVGLIMGRASSRFYESMIADYALFRSFEEESFYKQTQTTYWNEYRQIKEISGGKRTADRIFWLSKSLYPEYRSITNQVSLYYQMMKDGRIPTDVGCALFDLDTVVKVDFDKYLALASIIQPWYQNIFLQIVKAELISKIPSKDLEIILLCRQDSVAPEVLGEAFDTINDLNLAHRQWLASWVLSQNPQCSQELLANMWSQYSGNFSYTNVQRNLVRHPNFPLGSVHQIEITNDDHLIRSFNEVCQKRQFIPNFSLSVK